MRKSLSMLDIIKGKVNSPNVEFTTQKMTTINVDVILVENKEKKVIKEKKD